MLNAESISCLDYRIILSPPEETHTSTRICCVHLWLLIMDPRTFGAKKKQDPPPPHSYCKWFKSIPFMQHRVQEAQYILTKYAI